jgi:hypothetical protein
MVDVTGATTALGAVSNAAGTVSNLVGGGPAAALSNITGGLSDALGAAGSFLGQFGGNPGGITKLPVPNPLSAYASYNYNITLSAMSWTDHNFPDTSYKAGKTLPIICATASKNPNNRVQTKFGKFEFYIDNVRFDSAIGLNNAKSTNVTTVQFDIIEPYSIGMFPLALQTAAQKLNPKSNWRDCFFLLTIEFRGNKEAGTLTSIPNSTRHIPVKLTTMTFKANEQGASYGFNAYATNSQALTVQYANLKTESTIRGKTVQEILQTGEQSLQAVLNRKEKEYVAKKDKAVADEYVILFPQDMTSAVVANAANTNTSSTVNPGLQSSADTVYSKLGVVESSINSSHIQQDSSLNELGAASMGYDLSKLGDPTTKSEVKVLKNNVFIRGNVVSDIKEGSLRFTQDTDIPTIINTVLMMSDYPRIALDTNNEKDGFKTWWRIDTQVYCIDTSQNETSTNTIPKIIVYRVVPYDAHASAAPSVNVKAEGLEKIDKQLVKVYDYIFTGKNSEVIKFDIDFSISFANVLAADAGRNNMDIISAKSEGGEEAKEPTVNQNPKGISNPTGVIDNTSVRLDGTRTSLDGKGGGGRETAITRAAKTFHDAITSPLDMVVLNMEIQGDPFWIINSGVGNYTSKKAPLSKDLNSDGSVNWQSSEVHIKVNFRNPIDINQTTGLYNFKAGGYNSGSGTSDQVGFNGLYKVNTIESNFRNGEFRQTLRGQRIKNQDNPAPAQKSGPSSNIPDVISDVAGQVSSLISSGVSSITSAVQSVVSDVKNAINN